MSCGQYMIANELNRYFIRLSGELRYSECAPFSRFVNQIKQCESAIDAIIDMRGVTFLDSTNIGVVATLACHILQTTSKKMTILSKNEDVNELLVGNGFEEICLIVTDDIDDQDQNRNLSELTNENDDMRQMLITAHKTLAGMNQVNEDAYHSVIELLEKNHLEPNRAEKNSPEKTA